MARADLGQHGVAAAGEARRRLEQVEVGEEVGVLAQGWNGGPRRVDQLAEDAAALTLLVLHRLLEGVVRLHDLQRLEVVAAAGGRAAVDEAAGAPLGAGLEDDHQPAAAHRDGVLRKLLLVAADEVAQLAVDLVADGADLAAQGGEAGAGVLPHLAAAVEHAVDLPHQVLDVRQPGGQLGERRAGRNRFTDARHRRPRRLAEVGQPHQV